LRSLVFTTFIFIHVTFLFGQDGSNINYVKPESLNEKQIGRVIQIDFYRKSFGALASKGNGVNIDKILLEINGKKIEFIEHREDDGFNNWFSGQYLESIDKKIRIKEFKLLKIEKESILVMGYFTAAPFKQEFSFKKKDIAEILIKSIDEN
jgi:hypothetical protein